MLLFHAATDAYTDDRRTLNHLAHTIALRVEVFARRSASGHFTQVPRADTRAGIMEEAGAKLSFPDRRPPWRELSMFRRDLPLVIEALRRQVGGA